MMQRITIIDLDSIIYIVAYQNQDERLHSIVQDETRNFINTILEKTEAEGYVGFYQIVGHKNYRKLFFPAYKSKRPPTPDFVLKWRDSIIEVFKEFAGIVGLTLIESDDAISITANKYKHKYDITCARIDKDLDCIPGRHYHYKTEKFKTISEEEANFFAKCQVLSGKLLPGLNSLNCGKLLRAS